MRHLRLAHPELDFWVDVRVRCFDGRWLAVADLADQPDVGTGLSAQEAVLRALGPIGEPHASEMVDTVVWEEPA
jgi:hypothetical protein